jgi:HSP20 family protein
MANREWFPHQEFDRFRRDFDDLLDRFLGGRGRRQTQGAIQPALESFIENQQFVVRIDLPGINPDDIEVTADGDELTIRGKREFGHETKSRDFISREVSYGGFERSFRLPEGVDASTIKATYRGGVLELTAAVSAKPTGRKVPIESERDG